MAENLNKLIFTDEGRRLLVSQENGIRFAIIGAVLIQGLKPVDVEDVAATYKGITLNDLINDNNIVLGIKNLQYVSLGNGKIKPASYDDYNDAFKTLNRTDLIDIFYTPSTEIKDKNANVYGTYNIEIDKTALIINWQNTTHTATFSYIGLIGKIYAEHDDAVFNVADLENPALVAIAQLDGIYDETTSIFTGGIEFQADQNSYTGYMIKLRMTVSDTDYDFSEVELPEDLSGFSNKFVYVNNGLLNKKDYTGLASYDLNETEFTSLTSTDTYQNLGESGCIATPRTLMVADATYASNLENQFNAIGIIHAVNKTDDNGGYKPQYILTTVEPTTLEATTPITTYSVCVGLNGAEDISNSRLPPEESYQNSPIFKQYSIDNLAVDIFGSDNLIVNSSSEGKNFDKMLFSNNNKSICDSNSTTKSNLFVLSDNNDIKYNSNTYANILINSDKNSISSACANNVLLNSNENTIGDDESVTSGNILLGSNNCFINDAQRLAVLNGDHIEANGIKAKHQYIFGKYNENKPDASIIFGNGSDFVRRNAFEFYTTNDAGQLNFYYGQGNENALFAQIGGATIGTETSVRNSWFLKLRADNLWSDYIIGRTIETDAFILKNALTVGITNPITIADSFIGLPLNGTILFGQPTAENYKITTNNISFPGLSYYSNGNDAYNELKVNTITGPYTNNIKLNTDTDLAQITITNETYPSTKNGYIKLNVSNDPDYGEQTYIELKRPGSTNVYYVATNYDVDADIYIQGNEPSAFNVILGTVRCSTIDAPSAAAKTYIQNLINNGLIGYTNYTQLADNNTYYYIVSGTFSGAKQKQELTSFSGIHFPIEDQIGLLFNSDAIIQEQVERLQNIKLNIYTRYMTPTGATPPQMIISWLPFKAATAINAYGNTKIEINCMSTYSADSKTLPITYWNNTTHISVGDYSGPNGAYNISGYYIGNSSPVSTAYQGNYFNLSANYSYRSLIGIASPIPDNDYGISSDCRDTTGYFAPGLKTMIF